MSFSFRKNGRESGDIPTPPEWVKERAASLPRVHTLDEAVELLESFGITVHFWDLVGTQGTLLSRLGKPYVAVDRKLRECEKAFTLLHELGHFLLHSGGNLHTHLSLKETLYLLPGLSLQDIVILPFHLVQFFTK